MDTLSALWNKTTNDFSKMFTSQEERFDKGDTLLKDEAVFVPLGKKCSFQEQSCIYTAQGDVLCGNQKRKQPHVCFGIDGSDGNPLNERGYSQYYESRDGPTGIY